MAGVIVQTIMAFILTGVVGGWIAHKWQTRSAQEARFFEASKVRYEQMLSAADDLSALIGKRLYASQRICMMSRESADFTVALKSYRSSVVEWNERLLSLELAVRTRFRDTSLFEFERLQRELANASVAIDKLLRSETGESRGAVLRQLRGVRANFFNFTQRMLSESRLLHRQMYFGVLIRYDQNEIDRMSTKDLVKALVSSRVEGESVVRSPTDFGLPVRVGDAWLGIH